MTTPLEFTGDGPGEGTGDAVGEGLGTGVGEGDDAGPGVGVLCVFCGSLGDSSWKSVELFCVSCVLPASPPGLRS